MNGGFCLLIKILQLSIICERKNNDNTEYRGRKKSKTYTFLLIVFYHHLINWPYLLYISNYFPRCYFHFLPSTITRSEAHFVLNTKASNIPKVVERGCRAPSRVKDMDQLHLYGIADIKLHCCHHCHLLPDYTLHVFSFLACRGFVYHAIQANAFSFSL